MRQECEVLKEQLEEEQESKQELQRLVSKLNTEVTHWRTKHESDAIQHADELEDTKYVAVVSRILLCMHVLNNTRVAGRSWQRGCRRLRRPLRPLRPNAPPWRKPNRGCRERWRSSAWTWRRWGRSPYESRRSVMRCLNACSSSQASSCGQALDKKQRVLEKQLGDWKQKCDELVAEVEGCQKESRQQAGELFKLKTAHEESLEQLEALRRENKAYQGKCYH